MSKFEIWSLVFAGITACGVVVGLIVSFFKFWFSRKKKVLANFSNLDVSKYKNTVHISVDLDIINQTNIPTSILSIELFFGKFAATGKHTEQVIRNLLTTVDTKNIMLYPFESVTLHETQFECPAKTFCENAVIKIKTTQHCYKYPILCRTHEEVLE